MQGQLTIVPATATLQVINGNFMPVDLDAKLDGRPVDAAWVVDLSSTAGVDENGVVTATGKKGGEVKVKARYAGKTATATITVTLQSTVNEAGVSGESQALLKAAAAQDPTVRWAYPYDGTVFPKGLMPPTLMWNGSEDGDQYYLHLTNKYVDVELFTAVNPPARLGLDDAPWKGLWELVTESGPGGDVKVHVARLPPGAAAATVVANHTWTVANGNLRGTVYYWANSLGRVVRIKPGATAPDDFLAVASQGKCTACHAVSADGSTLTFTMRSAVESATYDGVYYSAFDLKNNSPQYVSPLQPPDQYKWVNPAISPDGKYVLESGVGGLWDAKTGQKLTGTSFDNAFFWMPSFAPDGSKIAFVDGDLALKYYLYDAAQNQLAKQPVKLVEPGINPALDQIAYPSVSPDGKWVIYHRGSQGVGPAAPAWCNTPQGPIGSVDTRCGYGYLYMASVEQPGTEVRLANANGDAYPFVAGDRDRRYDYEPTFAPLNAGGYMWAVFTSRRTYGNLLTKAPSINSESTTLADGVKQLWVMAIDQNPIPGKDPSHPAFHIDGQDLNTLNMRGYWSLDAACKQNGEACTSGTDCCNGNCDEGVCKKADPSQCADAGDQCDKSEQCCGHASGVSCVNHVCSEPTPH